MVAHALDINVVDVNGDYHTIESKIASTKIKIIAYGVQQLLF